MIATGTLPRSDRPRPARLLLAATVLMLLAAAAEAAERPVRRGPARSAAPTEADLAAAAQRAFDAEAAVAPARSAVASAQRDLDRKLSLDETAQSRLASAKAASARDPSNAQLARQAAAAKEAAAKASADRAAAEKVLAEKTAALRAAQLEAALAKDVLRGGLKPLDESAWDYVKARHLLVRAGFGGTPDEVEKLHSLGLHGAVDYLVDFVEQSPMDLAFHGTLPLPYPNESRLTPEQRRDLSQRRMRGDSEQIARLRTWWLTRLIESPRPLEEKLVLFWHGHFATEYRTTRQAFAMYQQNQLLREHAAGNFAALLHGIVHDPAMLRYLDNNRNVKGRPNENLAREIMELFSMGVGNYTEQDIKEAARALTGYTYDTRTAQFRFVARNHDTDNKTIFGRTGNYSGDDLVDLILAQPPTARFISQKLFVYFVHEDPSPETIDTLADVLRRHQYELAPLLKNIFLSEEFYSPRTMGTQIRSPVQLLVGAYRDLGMKGLDYTMLATALRSMDQDLFDPPNVKGWEGGRKWVNSNLIFSRYNALADAIERIPRAGTQRGIDIVGVLAARQFASAEEVVDYLARSCLLIPLSDSERQELVEFVGPLPPSSQWAAQADAINARLRALLVHLMSTPKFQLT